MKSTYLKFVILLIMVGGVFSGFLLVRNTRLLSSSALTPASVGNVNVNVDEPQNGASKVTLTFKTGSENGNIEPISTVSIRLKATSKSGSSLGLVDAEGKTSDKVVPAESLDSKWKFPVNSSSKSGNGFSVDFLAVNIDKDGYSSGSSEALVTFFVKGLVGKSDLSLEFDKDNSFMYSKRRPVTNIWSN